MATATPSIRTYFAKLGLDEEIADIYLALHTYGPQSMSELSRSSGVERTRLYRLLDKLTESNLIETETHYKRSIIKPAPIANLHILISQKEQELKSLQDELELVEQVLARNSLSSPATRIQFYQGPEGVKQMLWNQTRSQTEIISILYENIQSRTKERFFERWAIKCNEQGIHARSVFGDTFIASQKNWYAHHNNERLKHWEGRYVSPDIFPIAHSTTTYDDVVVHFNWKDNEVFGIEIYNREIADTQRRFFELLWEKAEQLKEPV